MGVARAGVGVTRADMSATRVNMGVKRIDVLLKGLAGLLGLLRLFGFVLLGRLIIDVSHTDNLGNEGY